MAESDRCSCEECSQTSRYILQECPFYIDLHAAMLERINISEDYTEKP